jgi:ArsR family transcriptional regulator, arsenate/arsenite/antimonite-responsive transcriptional repressor
MRVGKCAVPIRTDRRRGERCCGPAAQPTVRTAEAERLTGDLTILAHPVRLQLLDVLLHNEGRVCVCDLEAAVPVKQPTVSHHLRLLRDAGLVTSERDGLWAYYRVQRDALAALRARIEGGLRDLG